MKVRTPEPAPIAFAHHQHLAAIAHRQGYAVGWYRGFVVGVVLAGILGGVGLVWLLVRCGNL